MYERSKRSSGIELLRILLMIMIVILHISLRGGILYSTSFGSLRYFAAWLLESLCFCAVNGYAMITGYVSCESNFRYSKIIPLWLQVFFWNVLINIGFIIWGDVTVSPESFLPVSGDVYWYFSAYTAMFFFIPFFNRLIAQLDLKGFTVLAATLFLLFSFYANCFAKETDPFDLQGGDTVVWLTAMYFLGAYIKKFGGSLKIKKRLWLAVFLVSGSIPAISSYLLDVTSSSSLGESIYTVNLGGYMLEYNSPFMVIAAAALFMIFKDIDVSSPKAAKATGFFSGASFGVYIIHTHPLIFENVIKDRFSVYADLSTPLMLICVILTAAGAYIVLSLAERARITLFGLLKVRENVFRISDAVVGRLKSMKLK